MMVIAPHVEGQAVPLEQANVEFDIRQFLQRAQNAADAGINIPVTGGGGPGGAGSLFAFHSGGIVPGPVGRERLIVAQGGEAVLTPGQQRAVGGGGGGNTFNISISAIDGASVKAIVPEIAAELDKHVKGTGAIGLLT